MSDTKSIKNYLKEKVFFKTSIFLTGIRMFVVASGFLLDATIAALFGIKMKTDAFFVANTIPVLISMIIMLQVPVIQPIYINIRNSEGTELAWKFINIVFTACILLFVIVGILGSLASPVLIPIQIPGYDNNATKLAIELSRFLFVCPFFSVIIEIASSILNVHGIFYSVAIIKLFENLFKVGIVIFLYNDYGIFSLLYGTILGPALMVFVCIILLYRLGLRFRPSCKFNDPHFIKLRNMSSYLLFGFFATSSVQLLQNYLSSYLPEGSLSALRYATRIVDSFAGILSGGVVAVITPNVAHNYATENILGMKESILKGITMLGILTIPVIVWICAVHTELISILFERKEFTAYDTLIVANLLLIMSPYIFLSRIFTIAEAGFFSATNARYPLFISILLSIANVILILNLFEFYAVYSFGFARTISYCIGAILTFLFLKLQFGAIDYKYALRNLSKIMTASFIMYIAILGGKEISYISIFNSGNWNKIISFCSYSFLGGVAFCISVYVMWFRTKFVKLIS